MRRAQVHFRAWLVLQSTGVHGPSPSRDGCSSAPWTKLQEIRDALDDDAVFNVVGEVLPSAHVERVLRDYYAGKLGDADLEERLLKDVDEGHFRAICQTALEGLAAKKLNLDMLIERRARTQERRVVPETIARFIKESAQDAALRSMTTRHRSRR